MDDQEQLASSNASVIDSSFAKRFKNVIDRRASITPEDETDWPENGDKMPDRPGYSLTPNQIRVNLDPGREVAKATQPFFTKGDIDRIAQIWRNAKIQVRVNKEALIIDVRIVPS